MMIFVYFFGFALFSVIFTREVIAPASGANCDKRWRIYSMALNAANFLVVFTAGYLFQNFIEQKSIFHIKSMMNDIWGGIVVFLCASFFAYWWHRLLHKSDTLWRFVHQLHHAPSRIEALTAFYVHPFDALLAALLNAIVAYLILGASGISAAISMLLVTIYNLIAHADQKTPQWLGYFTQRPEMHRVHHEFGVHKSNYGLPIWDLMFGTFKNPQIGPKECGFETEKQYLIKEMLSFKDVKG